MKPSKKALQILGELKHSELLKLAKEAGNENIYLDFVETNDLAGTSKKLHLEEEYKDYLKVIKNAWQTSNEKVDEILTNYQDYLLEKIIFPDNVPK